MLVISFVCVSCLPFESTGYDSLFHETDVMLLSGDTN